MQRGGAQAGVHDEGVGEGGDHPGFHRTRPGAGAETGVEAIAGKPLDQ